MYAELMVVINMHGCAGFWMQYAVDIEQESKVKMAK